MDTTQTTSICIMVLTCFLKISNLNIRMYHSLHCVKNTYSLFTIDITKVRKSTPCINYFFKWHTFTKISKDNQDMKLPSSFKLHVYLFRTAYLGNILIQILNNAISAKYMEKKENKKLIRLHKHEFT